MEVNFTNIVWHDPNVFGAENEGYWNTHLRNINVERFSDVKTARKFLEISKKEWIIITSGSQGQNLLNGIHNLKNAKSVIVFCMNVQYHQTWAKDYTKVVVVTSSFSEAVEYANQFYKVLMTHKALKISTSEDDYLKQIKKVVEKQVEDTIPSSKNTINHYYHHSAVLEKEFQIVINLVSKTNFDYTKKVKDEIQNISNDKVKSAILFQSSENAFHGFIQNYSSDHIYREYNSILARADYPKVMYSIAFSIQEVKKYQDMHLNPLQTLYRGLRKDYINISSFSVGQNLFWPGYTSTSKDENVAKGFASADGYIFIIELLPSRPHYHLVLNNWSIYPLEKEVLLLPYFPFTVKKIDKSNRRIYIFQRDYDVYSEENKEKANEHVVKLIEEHIVPTVKAIFKKMLLTNVEIDLYKIIENFMEQMMHDIIQTCSEDDDLIIDRNENNDETLLLSNEYKKRIKDSVLIKLDMYTKNEIGIIVNKYIEIVKHEILDIVKDSICSFEWPGVEIKDLINALLISVDSLLNGYFATLKKKVKELIVSAAVKVKKSLIEFTSSTLAYFKISAFNEAINSIMEKVNKQEQDLHIFNPINFKYDTVKELTNFFKKSLKDNKKNVEKTNARIRSEYQEFIKQLEAKLLKLIRS